MPSTSEVLQLDPAKPQIGTAHVQVLSFCQDQTTLQLKLHPRSSTRHYPSVRLSLQSPKRYRSYSPFDLPLPLSLSLSTPFITRATPGLPASKLDLSTYRAPRLGVDIHSIIITTTTKSTTEKHHHLRSPTLLLRTLSSPLTRQREPPAHHVQHRLPRPGNRVRAQGHRGRQHSSI